MRATTPRVVAAQAALCQVYIEIHSVAVVAHIAVVELMLAHTGVEVIGSNVECAHAQRLCAYHLKAIALLVGERCPAYIGLVAVFLRTDVGIELFGHS